MSVKVENRPENRFETYAKINVLVNSIVQTFDVSKFKKLLDVCNNVRSSCLTFNFLDVFREEQFKQRVAYQAKTLENLFKIKSILELMLVADDFKQKDKVKQFFTQINQIAKSLRQLMNSDQHRHDVGEENSRQEYNDAKKVNFYKEKHYELSSTPIEVLSHADPFDVKNLVFSNVEEFK